MSFTYLTTLKNSRKSSPIESAKACKLDVYAYLRFVFEYIPFASVTADYEKLLPHNLNAHLLKLPAGFSAV